MKICYADTPDCYTTWLNTWQQTTAREVFTHPAYAGLWADDKTRACAAVYEGEAGTVLYPFLLRDITKEPCWRPEVGPAFDVVTPYGYGGVEWVAEETAEGRRLKVAGGEVFRDFYKAFSVWAADMGVVSEFVRFSLFSGARSWYYGTVEHNNDNIVAKLELSQEELWKGYRHKVRKNVHTAQGQGLRVVADWQGERLDDFLGVYHDTMRRRRAAPDYFFPRAFFEKLLKGVPGGAVFFHVLHQERVVASELVLCAASRIYSFLGGTLRGYFPMRPGDLLKVHIMEWAQQQGYKEFVIGGGYRPHDGVFSFKKAFAPQGIVPFYTGRMVFDPHKYRLLCEAVGKPLKGTTEEGFFPEYRE